MAGIILFAVGSCALLIGSWLHIIPFSITEDFGFITGAMTVWLTVMENIWTFPVGIANNLFFFVLFLHAGLFAAMSLQVIYIILSLQGWSLWSRRRKNKTVLQISNVTIKEVCILAGITLSIYIPMYAFGHLYLTSVVYLTFLIMSFVGLVVWRRSKKNVYSLDRYA
ncbi:MAG: nicotinamide mononucleotide transporter [Ktedonobacteraceae bacterium]|nr:nicotinamide mononucleotide transporter [Ktedonobacteraceae bacterium]